MQPSSSDIALAKKHPVVGAPLQVHQRPVFISIIGAIVALAGGAVLYYDIYQRMGSVPSLGSSTSPVGILIVLLALIGLICGGVVALMTLGMRVLACEGGVIVAEHKRAQVIPWTDIAAVYYSMHGPIHLLGRCVELEKTDGKRVSIAGGMYRNCFQIAEALIEPIRPRIMREAQERLARGESVPFGKRIAVTTEGLECDGQFLPKGRLQTLEWGSMRPTVTGGRGLDSAVGIISADGSKVIFTIDVPNVPILLDLLESQLGVKAMRLTSGFF